MTNAYVATQKVDSTYISVINVIKSVMNIINPSGIDTKYNNIGYIHQDFHTLAEISVLRFRELQHLVFNGLSLTI